MVNMIARTLLLATSGALGAGSAAYYFSGATAASLEAVSYSEVMAQLVERGSEIAASKVEYRQYNVRTVPDHASQLLSIVQATQTAATADLAQDVEDWLEALPELGAREAWSGTVWVDVSGWRLRRDRLEPFDTVAESLAEAGQGSSSARVPIIQSEWTCANSLEIITVQDGRAVIYRAPVGTDLPLMPLDCTLAPWADGIEAGPAPGQSIIAHAEGTRRQLVYSSASADGVEFVTTYEFDSALDWAPTRVTTTRNGDGVREVSYGYSIGFGPPQRPQVTARVEMVSSDIAHVVLFIVESWSIGTDPSEPDFRIPPLRLDIDASGEGDPVATLILPSFLDGVAATDWVGIGTPVILSAWGTDELEADLNADGIVNAADFERLLQEAE